MNKYKINFLSYVTTILWTILGAIIFAGAIIYYAQYDVINNASSYYSERVFNEYIKNTVISQNEDLEASHPNDYRIDLHLGYLYNVVKEYDRSEYYYKKAIEKAPMNIYKPLYSLASFYIERGRFDEAIEIMEILPQKSNESLIKYQARLYCKLGDAYYKKSLYYKALQEYEKAAYYWKKLYTPGIKYMNQINDKIFNSAILLADICVNSNRVDDAVQFLRRAEHVKPKDYNVRYKLALTLADSHPEESCKYFNKLFKQDPTRINYKAYYNILTKLSDMCAMEGDTARAKLYDFRAKELLENVYQNLIYLQDIDFRITNASLVKRGDKYKIILKFRLQNISNYIIQNLSIDVVYKLNNQVIETYSRQLIDSSNHLLPGDSIGESTIIPDTYRKYQQTDIPNISVEVLLYKNKNRKLTVYNGPIFSNTKIKIEQSKNYLDCQSYIKFFAEQLLNFGHAFNSYKESK